MKLNQGKQYLATLTIRKRLLARMWVTQGEDFDATHRALKQMTRRSEDLIFGVAE